MSFEIRLLVKDAITEGDTIYFFYGILALLIASTFIAVFYKLLNKGCIGFTFSVLIMAFIIKFFQAFSFEIFEVIERTLSVFATMLWVFFRSSSEATGRFVSTIKEHDYSSFFD